MFQCLEPNRNFIPVDGNGIIVEQLYISGIDDIAFTHPDKPVLSDSTIM
jgi:hypothetical protein